MKKEFFFNSLGIENKLLVKFKNINKFIFNRVGMKDKFFNSLETKNELLKV